MTDLERLKMWAATGLPITLKPEDIKAIVVFVEVSGKHMDAGDEAYKKSRKMYEKSSRHYKWSMIWSAVMAVLWIVAVLL